FDTIIFGPSKTNFYTYKLICKLSYTLYGNDKICISSVGFTVFNRTVTGQFTMHIFASLIAGLVMAFPFILYQIWLFVKPALTKAETNYARGLVGYGSLLFILGISFGYFVITPISLNFLGNYQVSETVGNEFSLESYINFVVLLTFAAGII